MLLRYMVAMKYIEADDVWELMPTPDILKRAWHGIV